MLALQDGTSCKINTRKQKNKMCFVNVEWVFTAMPLFQKLKAVWVGFKVTFTLTFTLLFLQLMENTNGQNSFLWLGDIVKTNSYWQSMSCSLHYLQLLCIKQKPNTDFVWSGSYCKNYSFSKQNHRAEKSLRGLVQYQNQRRGNFVILN